MDAPQLTADQLTLAAKTFAIHAKALGWSPEENPDPVGWLILKTEKTQRQIGHEEGFVDAVAYFWRTEPVGWFNHDAGQMVFDPEEREEALDRGHDLEPMIPAPSEGQINSVLNKRLKERATRYAAGHVSFDERVERDKAKARWLAEPEDGLCMMEAYDRAWYDRSLLSARMPANLDKISIDAVADAAHLTPWLQRSTEANTALLTFVALISKAIAAQKAALKFEEMSQCQF